jgi:hypothetical protein
MAGAIVPISTAVLPLIGSDGPRMPAPSRKSTFRARCFLTGQRQVGTVANKRSMQLEEDFVVNDEEEVDK